MAFRKVARKPEVCPVDWGAQFEVLPWTEDKTEDIADGLFGAGAAYFTELQECSDGTRESARLYLTRARKYVTEERGGDAVGYAASSLAYDKTIGTLVAVCLCCGGSVHHLGIHPAYRGRGIATRMLKHALTVHVQHGSPEFYLWRKGDSGGVQLYRKLGFQPTGEVEGPLTGRREREA